MQQDRKTPAGIIIFGTGNVGSTIARLAVQRGWRLSCAANRAGDKIGRDFAELSGFGELAGITVSDAARTDFSSLGADTAIVAVSDRLHYNQPHHKRLMEAGLNVICLGTESSYPWAVDEKLAREYDRIAKANGVSITGGGFWDVYRISTLKTLVGPCTRLDKIRHRSVTNADRFGTEVMRLAKIGEPCPDVPGTGSGDVSATEHSIYRVLIPQVVNSIGLTVEVIRERREPVVSDEPVHSSTLDATIAPGLCIGMRTVVEVDTKEGVEAVGEIDLRLTRPGEEESISWSVKGDPPAEMTLTGLDTGHATASSVLNRIPDLLGAAPGLITVDQMRPMQPFHQPTVELDGIQTRRHAIHE